MTEPRLAATLPKLELHSHLEGVISPNLARRLAQRNQIKLDDNLFDGEGNFAWDDFVGFLKAYDMASACIRKPQDYRDVTYEYLMELAAHGAIYAETFSSPDHAAMVGMNYEQHLEGIIQGIDDAYRDSGMIGRLNISCVRHLGADSALNVAKQMVACPHPYVVGFGMGGNEAMYDYKDFIPAYRLAGEHGYHLTAHAGEFGGAQNVKDAIDDLQVSRIGHGVRVIEDKDILAMVVERKIMLEVCPGSNIALQVFPDYAHHPLLQLIEAGCKISLSSDDPPYFASSLHGEYERAMDVFGLDLAKIHQINRDTLQAAFCDENTKTILAQKLTLCEQ